MHSRLRLPGRGEGSSSRLRRSYRGFFASRSRGRLVPTGSWLPSSRGRLVLAGSSLVLDGFLASPVAGKARTRGFFARPRRFSASPVAWKARPRRFFARPRRFFAYPAVLRFLVTRMARNPGHVPRTGGCYPESGRVFSRPRRVAMQKSSVLAAVFLCVACSSHGSEGGAGGGDGGTGGPDSSGGVTDSGADVVDSGGGPADSGGGLGDTGGGDTGVEWDGDAPLLQHGRRFLRARRQAVRRQRQRFRMRGVDRSHYDSNSQAGIAKSGANTVRIFVETNYGESVAGLVNIVQTQHIAEKEVPIPTAPSTTRGTATNCNIDPIVLTSPSANQLSRTSTGVELDPSSRVSGVAQHRQRVAGLANSTVNWRELVHRGHAVQREPGWVPGHPAHRRRRLRPRPHRPRDVTRAQSSRATRSSTSQFALHLYDSVNDYTAPISGIKK